MKRFKTSSSILSSCRNKTVTLLLSAFILVVISSCGNVNTDGSEGTGKINFHMTNTPTGSQSVATQDPGPAGENIELTNIDLLQAVNIDVQEVVVRYSPTSFDTVSVDSVIVSEDDSEWLTVSDVPFMVNLLELTNADMLFAEAELPEGYFSEIRLVLGQDNHVVDENGDVHELRVPSDQQSGYKINFTSRLHSGESFDLTINFDAQSSIHRTGNGLYMLQPVLRANRGRMNPD